MNTAFRLLGKRKASGGVTTYGVALNGINQYLADDTGALNITYMGAANYIKFKITKPSSGNQTIISSDYIYSGSNRDWTWLSIQSGTLTVRGQNGTSVPTSYTLGPAGLFSAAGAYDVNLVWPTTRSYQLTVNGVLYTGTVPLGYQIWYKYMGAKGAGNTITLSEYSNCTIHSIEIKDANNLIHTYENTTGTGTVWEDILNGFNFNLINGPTWVPNP